MSLQDAYKAVQNGNLPEARRLIDEALREDPNNINALLMKMRTAELAFEREAAMQRVLQIDPTNAHALAFQDTLKAAAQQEIPAAPTPPPQTTIEAEAASAPQKKEPKPGRTVQKPDGTRSKELGTYQMLWDCEFCGTKKLLGLTHRFCPNCGAPQDANKRYFPSDDEKVLVEDHVYYGVDVTCVACNTLNSAKAEFCVQCGAPLSEGAKAKTLDGQAKGAGQNFASSGSRDLVKEAFDSEQARINPPKIGISKITAKPKVLAMVAAAVVAIIACSSACLYAIFATEEQSITVTGHEWRREVEILQFQAVDVGDWCDRMPSGAYSVSRSERQNGSRQVPDGESCSVRRVDNGDGTFSEREECRTTYRSEPIYEDYCEYTIDRWEPERTVTSDGDSLSDSLAWPQFSLAPGNSLAGSESLGTEKEGDRRQVYVVRFRNSENKTYECEFESETDWREFPVDTQWTVDVGKVTGEPDCDTLKPVT